VLIFFLIDIEMAKKRTGVSSVMVARGALWNPSIFRPNPLSKDLVIQEFVRYSVKWESVYQNTKYVLSKMTENDGPQMIEKMKSCKSMQNICRVVGLDDFYKEHQLNASAKANPNNINLKKKEIEIEELQPNKRRKVNSE
jgi:tRNA-dihydrouridine synthase 2